METAHKRAAVLASHLASSGMLNINLMTKSINSDTKGKAKKTLSFEDFKALVGKEIGVSSWHGLNYNSTIDIYINRNHSTKSQ
jgi:hypothetical protein